jgi:cytochrome P450
MITQYDDVVCVLREQNFGRRGLLDVVSGGSASESDGPAPMRFQAPPRHTRLRRLIGEVLTASLIHSLRPRIQRLADDLLDRVQDDHTMDLIADFAIPLPLAVIAELLGVPDDDRDLFHLWSLDVARGNETRGSYGAIAEYFRGALAERRERPRDDVLTRLIAVQENGNVLTEFELIDICGLLLVAGLETTANLIGNGMLALLLHPEEVRRLRENLALLPIAVEELLRYDSPVQCAGRMAEANVSIGGQTIPKGSVVTPVLGAANRDPTVFPDPNRLDITRRNNRHLAFGAGDRFCLGATLARAQGQIAIGTLLRRFPSVELASRPVAWRHSTETRGLTELQIVY